MDVNEKEREMAKQTRTELERNRKKKIDKSHK